MKASTPTMDPALPGDAPADRARALAELGWTDAGVPPAPSDAALPLRTPDAGEPLLPPDATEPLLAEEGAATLPAADASAPPVAPDASAPLVPQDDAPPAAAGPQERTPPDPETAWRLLQTKACLPYRSAGRGLEALAHRLLDEDPLYRLLLQRGCLKPRARVVDVGEDPGLVASLLYAARSAHRHRLWPTEWAAAPSARAYLGIHVRGESTGVQAQALSALPFKPHFVQGDVEDLKLPPCDVLLMLDLLRTVERKAQRPLLQRARDVLRPGGRLLLRVQDGGGWRGDRSGAWARGILSLLQGQHWPAECLRPLGEWKVLLWRMGFNVEAVHIEHSVQAADVLLVCTVLRST